MFSRYRKILIVCFCLLMVFPAFPQAGNLKLWYTTPAGKEWEAALPIGNGRLAAMVFGNPAAEVLKLNEGTVWSGGPSRNDSPELLAALPEVRQLIFAGKKKKQVI